MTRQRPFDLRPHLNAHGATYDQDRTHGALNAWGNTFPAEELPFGAMLEVGGVTFHLVPKTGEGLDHLEVLGQRIRPREHRTATGLALLCCGEMGDQEVEVEVEGETARLRCAAVARNWLVAADPPTTAAGHTCSHLHYPGGYELSLLRPTLWCYRLIWWRPLVLTELVFGFNPLFHLFAATYLEEGRAGD